MRQKEDIMKTLMLFFASVLIAFSFVSCAGTQNAKWVSPNKEKGISERDLTNKASEKVFVIVKNEDINPFTYKGKTILEGDVFPVEIPLRDDGKEISVRDGNGKTYKLFIESDRKVINKHIKFLSEFSPVPTEMLLLSSDDSVGKDVDLMGTSPNRSEKDIAKMFGSLDSNNLGVALTLKSVSQDTFFKKHKFTDIYNLTFNVWIVLSSEDVRCFDWVMPGVTWNVFNSNFHNYYEGGYDNFSDLVTSGFTLTKILISKKWYEKEISRRTGGNNKKSVDEYFDQESGIYLFLPEISDGKDKLKLYPIYSTYGGFYSVTEKKKTRSYIIAFTNTRSDKTFEIMFGGKTLMVDPGWIVAIEVPEDRYVPVKVIGSSYYIEHKGKAKKLHLILVHPNFAAFDKCPVIDKKARAQRSTIVATFFGSIDYFSGKESLKEKETIIPDSYIQLGNTEYGAEKPITVY